MDGVKGYVFVPTTQEIRVAACGVACSMIFTEKKKEFLRIVIFRQASRKDQNSIHYPSKV